MPNHLPLNELVNEVERRGNIDAMSLKSFLVAKGCSTKDAERTIQLALDKGVVRVGPKMHIVSNVDEPVTLEFIEHVETLKRKVDTYLTRMSRKIFNMNNGEGSDDPLVFYRGYTMFQYKGDHQLGVEYGAPWVEGTFIVSVKFEDSYQERVTYVTFPALYVGNDWEPIERERIEEVNKARAQEELEDSQRHAQYIEEKERAEYERLKRKFEGI